MRCDFDKPKNNQGWWPIKYPRPRENISIIQAQWAKKGRKQRIRGPQDNPTEVRGILSTSVWNDTSIIRKREIARKKLIDKGKHQFVATW